MENKLPQDLKDKWLTALRSGKYHQTKGQLFRVVDDFKEYCCIGVYALCNNIPMSISGEDMLDSEGYKTGYEPLREHIGQENTEHLYYMNDTQEKSFLEIADWIEENL